MPSQIAIDAFADALERAEPIDLAIRGLALAGRWAAAARVCDRAWQEEDDPIPTAICALLATFARLTGAPELTRTAHVRLASALDETKIGEAEFKDWAARLEATDRLNGERAGSVYEFLIAAADLRNEDLDDPTPAATARAARLAHPTAELAMILDLFFTGHPELALIDGRTSAGPSEVGLAAWWLASVQCGTIAEDADLWHHADYATPIMIDVLVSEAEGMLGHSIPVEIFGAPNDWVDALNARRSSGGARVTGSWKQVALAQSALALSPRTQAAYRSARASLQAGDASAAARALARAADEARDRRSKAALLTAAAHASALSDAGLSYAVSYADAAVKADVYYVPAACAALELAARAKRPGLPNRTRRLRSALNHSDTPETVEILRNAADAIALAAGDNHEGERFLDEAAEADPNSVVRWMALAEFRHRIRSFEPAIEAFEEAARREPTRKFRAHVYERIAEIFLYDIDDRVPAFESFLVSFVCWQGSASVLAQLEVLYESLGREAELPDTYRLAISFTERDPSGSEHDLARLREALNAAT